MRRSAPPFELNPRVAPIRAVRQAALAQVDHALRGLERGDDKAIHEARKVCKKLRALLRLIRPFLGGSYQAENRRVRDVGRALSQGRDAAVLIQTADRHLGRDPRFGPIADAIRARPQPQVTVSLAEASRMLQTQRRRVEEWPLRNLAPGSLMVGLLTSYRSARRGYAKSRRRPDAATLHEWRKQAKYHWHQWILASAFLPGRGHGGERARLLKQLADRVGEHHDLQVLSETLARNPTVFGGRNAVRAARGHIVSEQNRKARAALALGKKLFRDKPLDWFAREAVK